jgi:hypothetical protein
MTPIVEVRDLRLRFTEGRTALHPQETPSFRGAHPKRTSGQ